MLGNNSSAPTKMPIFSVFTVAIVVVIHLGSLVAITAATKMHYIHWNTSNPIFRIDNTDHIIDVNKNNFPYDYDQVNIICPTYDRSTTGRDTEKYIIYNVSKEEYDTCRITTLHPRVITVCNKPYDLMYVTITFRPFSPQPNGLEFRPGVDYYFISTSSSDDLERRIGGRCSSHHMKVVFKVCCDEDKQQSKPLGDQGGVQLPPNGGFITGSNSTLKIPTTTSLSTHKSGRTASTTPRTSSTTTTTTTTRRRYPPSAYNPAAVPSYDDDSGYGYNDYGTYKDYPDFVKSTTGKIDTRKYPDPRENEVGKNEALNSSPNTTTAHHLSVWWIMVVLISTIMVVNGSGGCDLTGCQNSRSCGGQRRGNASVESSGTKELHDGAQSKRLTSLASPHGKLCRLHASLLKNSCNTNSYDSNNLQLLQQEQQQYYSLEQQQNQGQSGIEVQQEVEQRNSSSEVDGDQAQQMIRVQLLCHQQQQKQCHSQQQWLHQRRKFNNQINSFRCRSRLSTTSVTVAHESTLSY